MTHITCRLTAKKRDQLRNPTLCNRVWATFNFLMCIQSSEIKKHYKTAQMPRQTTHCCKLFIHYWEFAIRVFQEQLRKVITKTIQQKAVMLLNSCQIQKKINELTLWRQIITYKITNHQLMPKFSTLISIYTIIQHCMSKIKSTYDTTKYNKKCLVCVVKLTT